VQGAVADCGLGEGVFALVLGQGYELGEALVRREAIEAVARSLITLLERRVGPIIVNGFPTEVEVCYARVHGGPFPATSDSRMTAVGTRAIERFLRPVSYQNFPAALLPESLLDGNPLRIPRLHKGQLEP
jgi:alpha-ketoglutaric semialdehyde dehydrogenase